jgi:hypothetical protein
VSAVEKYQKRAADLLQIARETGDLASKALLLEMAQAWVNLAERVRERPPDTSK